MTIFRLFLAAALFIILGYTVVAIGNDGWNFLSIFLRNIAAMGWSGQFNLDFYCFLLLTALWTAWRNHFSAGSIALGIAMTGFGFPLLAAYLLSLSYKTGGDIKVMMLGEARAKQG